MTNAAFSIAHSLPADYQALIWDSFFVQKQRGVDFQTHFPWAHIAQGDCAFGLLRHEGRLLAGATMRPAPFDSGESMGGARPDLRCPGIPRTGLEYSVAGRLPELAGFVRNDRNSALDEQASGLHEGRFRPG